MHPNTDAGPSNRIPLRVELRNSPACSSYLRAYLTPHRNRIEWCTSNRRISYRATDLARNTSYLLGEAASGGRITILNKNTLTAALVSIDDLRLLQQLDANRGGCTTFWPR